MSKFDDNKWIEKLNKLLISAIMSTYLAEAVIATRDALEQGDLNLAFEISGVKSYIVWDENVDVKNCKRQHFREQIDCESEDSVYWLIDSLNKMLSFEVDRVPAGMIWFGGGKMAMSTPRLNHPIINLMKAEHKRMEYRMKYGNHSLKKQKNKIKQAQLLFSGI